MFVAIARYEGNEPVVHACRSIYGTGEHFRQEKYGIRFITFNCGIAKMALGYPDNEQEAKHEKRFLKQLRAGQLMVACPPHLYRRLCKGRDQDSFLVSFLVVESTVNTGKRVYTSDTGGVFHLLKACDTEVISSYETAIKPLLEMGSTPLEIQEVLKGLVPSCYNTVFTEF